MWELDTNKVYNQVIGLDGGLIYFIGNIKT